MGKKLKRFMGVDENIHGINIFFLKLQLLIALGVIVMYGIELLYLAYFILTLMIVTTGIYYGLILLEKDNRISLIDVILVYVIAGLLILTLGFFYGNRLNVHLFLIVNVVGLRLVLVNAGKKGKRVVNIHFAFVILVAVAIELYNEHIMVDVISERMILVVETVAFLITLFATTFLLNTYLIRLKGHNENIVIKTSYDQLTKIYNRGTFEMYIIDKIKQNDDFFIVIFDLDYFKAVNDSCGHDAGDLLLASVADLVQENIRESDVLARYGGEEFAIVFKGVEEEDILQITKKLGHLINKHFIDYNGRSIGCTASFGITQRRASDDFESVIKRADHALYLAKENGRDCIYYDEEKY